MKVVSRLVCRVRLGNGSGLIRSVEPYSGAVIGAHAGEAGHHRKYRRLALMQVAFAPGDSVIVRIVCRVGGIEDLAPVGGAVALTRDEHDRRRSRAATFEIHLAAAADVDEAGKVRPSQA